MSTKFDHVKRHPTPAPNAYTISEPKLSACPSSAFHSDTRRFDDSCVLDVESEVTGNPHAASDKLKASKSFNKCGSTFGRAQRQTLPWDTPRAKPSRSPRDESPEPAKRPSMRRSPRNESPRPEPVKRPSGSFASKTHRFAPRRDSTPGPGSYTSGGTSSPSAKPSVKRSASFGSSKRFEEHKLEGPDPGTYTPRSAFTPPNLSGPSPAFCAKLGGEPTGEPGRQLFSRGSASTEATGPGAYHNELWNSMGGTAVRQRVFGKASAAFASRTGRFERPCGGSENGPGAYDPGETDQIAAVSARGTRGMSTARGAGGFGSSTARESRDSFIQRAVDSPGPGAYDAKPLQPHNGSQTERRSSAFASKTKKELPVRNTSTPAVGMYESFGANSSLAQSATKSFNKSGCSFGRAVRDIDAKVATEQPGPGVYSQDAHTFERSALRERGSMSSAFAASSYGRDSFLGL